MRKERDYLGEKRLPVEAYWGVQTQRAIENFPVSGKRERSELIRAYAKVKKAASISNMKIGMLDKVRGNSIIKASDEIISGKFADQFPIDVFQAGAGTSLNMNLNEVIANRALEILGKQKGDYSYISPNDHVNMSQSTNDTFSTASHIAIIYSSKDLIESLIGLSKAFDSKGDEFRKIKKSGRTHLMDALPIFLGDEFHAYANSIKRSSERINQRREDLLEVAIGGTAVGTGAGADKKYRDIVIVELSKICSLPLRPAENSFEAIQSRSQLVAFSGSLRELAVELNRIANDLRLLSSGPTSGFAEIRLPAVQPGSSIMPGKVNPSMPECLNMISFDVIGNDLAVMLSGQAGQLEMNVMTPLMSYKILESLSILNNFLPVFQKRCVKGITADSEQCGRYLEINPSLATFLVPKIGYMKASQVAKEALTRRLPVAQIAIDKGYITEKEANYILFYHRIKKKKNRG